MGEYYDYLMNAVDSCYQRLMKTLPTCPPNPLSAWQGKIAIDAHCDQCKNTWPMEEKDCSLQGCYISLASPIYPITSISFELYSYDVCAQCIT